jgi:peptide/nickel transport system substrate-binding protein
MWSVLEAVYDGPFDTNGFSTQPVILEKMPSITDGSARIETVPVTAGQMIINANGDLVPLGSGTFVQPAGCTGPDCAVQWDGASALEMDRMLVDFKLLPGLTWSDGAPLTANDSVYSFTLAADPATPVSRFQNNRTAEYSALDDLTARWTGVPGYLPQRYETLFWLPLPQHAWGQASPTDLLTAEFSSRSPLGWGAYIVSEWVAGDHIKLIKNPAYFRAGDGLPYFDVLVYRFVGEQTDSNLAAMLSGECDVVDQADLLDQEVEVVSDLQKANKLKAYVAVGPEWEQISFGIRPFSYDDGYNPASGDRTDLFADARVRQALALCMDRQQIVDRWLQGFSSVPAAYLPPSHPLYLSDLAALPYDATQGALLLDQAGWKDFDGDPATPRTAAGVFNVPDGTPFSINYATTKAQLRTKIAELMAANLAECGVQVNVQYYEPADLYAPGPDGLLFGRKFDLVQFGWESGVVPPCQFFESDQIPSLQNNWLGVNVSGYSNPQFDAACQLARQTRPDAVELYSSRQADVQRLFAAEVPAVPLYYRIKIALSRPDMCAMQADATARSQMWNIESLNYGEACR